MKFNESRKPNKASSQVASTLQIFQYNIPRGLPK